MPRIALFIALTMWGGSAIGQVDPIIAGYRAHCVDASGAPVYTMFNPVLTDSAQSSIRPDGVRLISVNPNAFQNMEPLMELFTYAHECGHHMSGDVVSLIVWHHDNPAREMIADKIGIRILRDNLGITHAQAQRIANFFSNNRAIPPYYLPGPARASWIIACYETNTDNCSSTVIYTIATPQPDGPLDFCASLQRIIATSPSAFSAIKGSLNKHGDGWWPSVSLSTEKQGCSISKKNRDYFCDGFSDIDYDDLTAKVAACLSDWDKTSEEYDRDNASTTTFTSKSKHTQVEIHTDKYSGLTLDMVEQH
jgi:hypothetical protein